MSTEKRGDASISTIIITFFAIVVIIALAFFYYYLAVKPYPSDNAFLNIPETVPAPKVESFSTEVINFVPPAILPAEIKEGDCQINSVAQLYRLDAFKCFANKVAYDPCFSTGLSDIVYCKMNPLEQGNDFLIKLTKPLPPPLTPKNIQDNWAWFVELRDGTYCSPYTEARPIFQGQAAFYNCKSNTAGEQIILMGDLKKDLIWTTEKAILVKSGSSWVIKSSEEAEVKTVWQ
ncbi:MAG: hypothetical protein AAB925_00275 [Patescibacteria group bacterium]